VVRQSLLLVLLLLLLLLLHHLQEMHHPRYDGPRIGSWLVMPPKRLCSDHAGVVKGQVSSGDSSSGGPGEGEQVKELPLPKVKGVPLFGGMVAAMPDELAEKLKKRFVGHHSFSSQDCS